MHRGITAVLVLWACALAAVLGATAPLAGDDVPKEVAEAAVGYANALARRDVNTSWKLLSSRSRGGITAVTWDEAFRKRPAVRTPSTNALLKAIATAETPPVAGPVLVQTDEAFVQVSCPVVISHQIVLMKEEGGWGVDLEATDELNSRRAGQIFLDAIREEAGAGRPPRLTRGPRSGAAMLQAFFAPEAADYQVLEAHVEGDRAEVTVGAEVPINIVLRAQRVGPGWMVDLSRPVLSVEPTDPDPLAKAAAAENRTTCQSQLRQLARAFQMYAAACDDALPDPDRWLDLIRPYLTGGAEVHCPADLERGVSYAMNRNLAGKRRREVADQNSTPLLFESTLHGRNPADIGESWADPPRHSGGNYVLYVDGSVRSSAAKPSFEVTEATPGAGPRSDAGKAPPRRPRTRPRGR